MEKGAGNIKHTVIALGKFDGVHRGHTALLEKTAQIARAQGLTSVVYTFPVKTGALMGGAEKQALFSDLGMDRVYAEEFTEQFRRMSAGEFVKNVLMEQFHARHVVVGFNYRFGYQRSGDAQLLAKLCAPYGVGVTVVEPVMADGEPISSTRVRALIEQGDVDAAQTLLGRRYAVTGEVLHGKQLGRTIGFPTVNLIPSQEILLPRRGVYATITMVDGKQVKGVTNVGPNPTVEVDAPDKVETHLFDFDGDLYGARIKVEFVEKLRDEHTFSSVDELRKQIEEDKKRARLLL
ncbi:MAG: bifunctional riboflavin kinase/FAD synthetase [Ruminococcaceae bacterium]|nr:bifunctional riboflavin kinase/FAD synthetase [Oscillospiraceae bacterium]